MGSGAWGESSEASGSWGAWGAWGEQGGARVPAERLPVRALPDGSYAAAWTPRAPGAYHLRCTLDELPAPQVLTEQKTHRTLNITLTYYC